MTGVRNYSRYGMKSDRGETVERTFTAQQKLGVEQYKNQVPEKFDFYPSYCLRLKIITLYFCDLKKQVAESVYESVRREPLGFSCKRGFRSFFDF